MNREYEHFVQLILESAHELAAEYFQLPIANADSAYRERVYCYELYHLLRNRWGTFPFTLSGEVDKTGHPMFRGGPYGRSKPDLLVHEAGQMNRNLAVVEVKPTTASNRRLFADLAKLSWYVENAEYYRGIMLLYGDSGDARHVRYKLAQIAAGRIDSTRLTCIYHPAPHAVPSVFEFAGTPAVGGAKP